MAASEPGVGVFRRLDRLNEFEREPVTDDKLHGGGYFAGSFSGEHVAATEFVIGALFVAGGARVYDVIVGLLLGNLLAVLSWTLVCAPIAVSTRLTLYWYLRKIAGPAVMVVYNVLNAALYCVLAGCMITVAASAVRIPFGIEPQTGWLPTDPWFVAVTISVGTVVVLLAILGFKRLAQFASVCSPWMLVMFIAGALVLLPLVGHFGSPASLWRLGEKKIWTGPPPYQSASVLAPGPGSQVEWPQIVLEFPNDAELWIDRSFPADDEEAASGEDAGEDGQQRGARTYEAEGAVSGFAISGNGAGERTFVEAEARLEGHTVIVSSRSVSDPAVVSYNEGMLDGNLRINQDGYLPVPSFRSYVQSADSVLTFWQIVAFAWICNLAMHLGLSDMALFRYARRSWYGLFSAFGMYLGHYVAWICAGVMGAAVASATMMNTPLTMLDSGEVAFRALGVMGALAVVIAGWTTSNPTLYRAGLALQVVTPGWPRWVVTLIAGAVTTAIACFPFVFRELLNFVGLYGLLLMPVGAIVVAEHWIFPRIGFERFWSTRKGQVLNRPALAAWAISLAAALVCWQAEALGGWLSENVHESLSAVAAIHVHLFYLAGPVWVLTVVLYLVFSAMAGAAGSLPELSEEEAEGRAEEEREEGEISATPTADAVPHAASTSRIYRYFAALALACLASIVLFSYCICVGYMAHDAVLLRIGAWSVDFGGYLVIATGVYFVSGVFWMIGRGERRGLSAA